MPPAVPTSTNGTTAGCWHCSKSADLAAGDADVPHAAPRQHLDGVPLVVGLGLGLVDRAHAAGAEGVHEGERPEDEALGLALQQALGLELGENALADEELGQGGRLGAGVLGEELADDLIELAAVDEVAAAQVPDEPFASPEVRSHHCRRRPLCSRGECAAHNPAPCPTSDPRRRRRHIDRGSVGEDGNGAGVRRFHSCRKDGTQKRGCQTGRGSGFPTAPRRFFSTAAAPTADNTPDARASPVLAAMSRGSDHAADPIHSRLRAARTPRRRSHDRRVRRP